MENLVVIINEGTTGVIGYVRIDKGLAGGCKGAQGEWKLRESTFSSQNANSMTGSD